MGRHTENRTRCSRFLLLSCSSLWRGHTPGHRVGPSAGPLVGHLAYPRTAKGPSATRTTREVVEDLEDRTTQEAAVEDSEVLRTARDPSATRTTEVVEVSVESLRPSSTTMFKTAREASATRTTQEEDLEVSHLGNSGFSSTFSNNKLPELLLWFKYPLNLAMF